MVMDNNICKTCINLEICGDKSLFQCDHYDVELTRSEIMNMLNTININDPANIPTVLYAIKRTYGINLTY